jgi:hypothetical protein
MTADGHSTISVMLVSSKKNLRAAVEACQRVLADFKAAGPSQEDTACALQQVLLQLKDAESDPNFWALKLSELHLHGASLDQIQHWPDLFRQMADNGTLTTLARHYLSGNIDGASGQEFDRLTQN